MKTRKKEESGARGDIVASRNRFGHYERDRVSPKNQPTAARRRVWGNMTVLSDLWNQLTEERRAAWRRLAGEVHSRPRLGQYGRLDGRLLFLKLNRVLATCGREPLLDPPPLPQFGQNPVEQFTISEASGRVALKLRLRKAPAEDILVFASPPRNAGRVYNSDYGFIGILPASDGTESDITELYLTKLKEWRKLKDKNYQVPLAGAKVFVQAVQQVNGWENDLWMFRSSAFVPAKAVEAGRVRGASGVPKGG